MNLKWLGIIFLFQICFNACQDNKEQQVQATKSDVEEALSAYLIEKKLDSLKFLVVIPNGGCSGCIDFSIRYLSMNLKKMDSVHVIFTHTRDKKLLKIQLGTENYYDKRIFIDYPNSEYI